MSAFTICGRCKCSFIQTPLNQNLCSHCSYLEQLSEIDWQSRALAAEKERDQIKAENADREKVQQEQLQMIVKSDEIISQLRAELQTAREAINQIYLEVKEMEYYYIDKRSSHIIRAILERIEKEKNEPPPPIHGKNNLNPRR